MSNHNELSISHPYPPSYRNISPRPAQFNEFELSPGAVPIPSHTEETRYPPDTPSSGYKLARNRSTSDSSIAPVLQMGVPEEREKAKGKHQEAESEYPPGWSKEDEEAEREFLKAGIFNWSDMKSWRFWIRKEWWYWYLGAVILGVLVALMALYHDEIVDWLTPVANWMKDLPAGWTIPIAIMFVLSFPPLFGQEIVAVLCGVVWGLWIGFGIVAAGTFFGEVGNFYAFKYWCRSRAEKYERDNLNYAIMAHVVRGGGFFFIFAVRLSAIPGHFSTAVFATCGMNIFVFSLACILTLPKQLIVVYLGVLFNEKQKSQKSKIISWVVLIVGFLITIWAVWYCYKEMNKVKLVVWRKQRMALAAKGISVDPVTGKRRRSYRESIVPLPLAREEEEILSPILRQHAEHPEERYPEEEEMRITGTSAPIPLTNYTHDPYAQTGYDTGYDSQYRPDSEADIGQRYGQQPESERFPQARPVQSQQAITRNPTTKSLYPDYNDTAPTSTAFPIAEPAGGPAVDFSRPTSAQYDPQQGQFSPGRQQSENLYGYGGNGGSGNYR